MSRYEVVKGHVRSAGECPRADDIFCRCRNCGGVLPSTSDDNIECRCRNIRMDVEYIRLHVDDFGQMQVARKIG